MLSNRLQTLASGPAWKHLGMDLLEASEGKSKVHMQATDEMRQFMGNVHGGILAALLDASMAAAVNTFLEDDVFSVTAEMKIQYVKPANGNSFYGYGEVVKFGRTLTIVKSEIRDDAGEIIAFGSATFFNKKKSKKD